MPPCFIHSPAQGPELRPDNFSDLSAMEPSCPACRKNAPVKKKFPGKMRFSMNSSLKSQSAQIRSIPARTSFFSSAIERSGTCLRKMSAARATTAASKQTTLAHSECFCQTPNRNGRQTFSAGKMQSAVHNLLLRPLPLARTSSESSVGSLAHATLQSALLY